MIPGPGTVWAFVMCDHEAILYMPPAYCRETVLPAQAWNYTHFKRYSQRRTDICKLSVLEDEKVVFRRKLHELIDEVVVEVRDEINVCL